MLAIAASVATTTAQQPDATRAESDRLAAAIAPLVDDQTLLIAHVDLRAFDAAATGAKLAEALQLPKESSATLSLLTAFIGQRVARLKEEGVQDIFLLSNVADMPKSPVMIVVPLAANETDKAKEIFQLLGASQFIGPKSESLHQDGNLVIALPAAIERVRKPSPRSQVPVRKQTRPEVADAFQAVSGSAAQVLFVPSAQVRRVVEEMMPKLPAEVGGGSIAPLTSGLRWIAFGVSAPPQALSVRFVAQASDAETATALVGRLNHIVTILARRSDVLVMVPKFEELARNLVPGVQGDQLTREWNESDGGLQSAAALLIPPLAQARAGGATARSVNNLKQFGLAMHSYADKYKTFPPRAILSTDGKPLLSWRVALLPFLDANDLYKEFHLDEPWDSEHNRALIDRMPALFRSPLSSAAAGRTTYLAPIVPKGIFGGPAGMKIKEIIDGLSNTILLVEMDDDHAVVWTKPEDIDVDPREPSKGMIVGPGKSLIALIADGSVRRFTAKELDPANLLKRLTANAGDALSE